MNRITRAKRTLIGLAIGGTVFGGVYGFAASLGVSSDTLGAGSAVVAACQPGTVNVTYATTYVAGSSNQATTVTLTNLDPTLCGGKAAQVTLSGASNALLGQQSITVPATGTTADLTFTGVNAAAVTGVHAVISG
jgi:hypothetical protein